MNNNLEDLKELIKFPCDLIKQTTKALEDGWQTWKDAPGFFDELMEIPDFVKALVPAGQRVKEGLNAEARQEIIDYVKEEFDIPNDKVEEFVEAVIAWVGSTYALYEMFKDLRNKAA